MAPLINFSFLFKAYLQQYFRISNQNITSLDGWSYEAIQSSISQNIFSYLKMFSMQCRKIITTEDNKIRMNITIHTNIYTYIICDKNDSN